MFQIEFYRLPNGKQPIVEFLDGLDTKMRAKALHSISILEEFGNQLREPHSKSMGDFRNYLDEQRKNPEFAAEYEAMRPEYEAIRAVIAARLESRMTQKELAEKTGIRQSNISRIESGVSSPTVETLARIASGLGKQLKIEFI